MAHPCISEHTAGPFFSFLTTAYLTEAYLPATIDSVHAQTRPDWEIVVVDNGRSDEIARIAESYAARDPRVRLVRQENLGYRGGIMAAAAVARGNYLCVLDSDDQLTPEFCARVGEVIAAFPDVAAVGIDAYRFDRPEHLNLPVGYMRSIGIRTPSDPNRRLTVADVLGGQVPYYTAAFRRDAWDAVGGYEPEVVDVDETVTIWLRLVSKYDVRLVPDRLARYRLRTDSLSRDPANAEEFENRLLRSFAVGISGELSAECRAAQQATVRRLRYNQSLRRGRYALLRGDVPAARAAARTACGYRHTMRAEVVRMSLLIAPNTVRRLHPVKQRASSLIERLAMRAFALLDGESHSWEDRYTPLSQAIAAVIRSLARLSAAINNARQHEAESSVDHDI